MLFHKVETEQDEKTWFPIEQYKYKFFDSNNQLLKTGDKIEGTYFDRHPANIKHFSGVLEGMNQWRDFKVNGFCIPISAEYDFNLKGMSLKDTPRDNCYYGIKVTKI